MKHSRANEIRAGIFLIITTLLTAALSLKVSGTLDLLTKETYQIKAHFPDTLGVPPKAKVTLLGVAVGRVVRKVLIYEESDTQVELILQLHKDKAILYENAWATITAETLLSEKHIDIFPGTPDRRRLADGDIISGTPAPDINVTLAKADEIVEAMRDIITSEEVRGNIKSFISQSNELVSDLRRVAIRMDEIIASNSPKISSVLDNFQTTSNNIHQTSKRIDEALVGTRDELHKLLSDADALINENRPDVRETVRQVRRSMDDITGKLEIILVDISELTTQLKQIAGDNSDEVNRMMYDAERTVENARAFFKQIADYPWQLVYPTERRRDTKTLYPSWVPAATEVQQ